MNFESPKWCHKMKDTGFRAYCIPQAMHFLAKLALTRTSCIICVVHWQLSCKEWFYTPYQCPPGLSRTKLISKAYESGGAMAPSSSLDDQLGSFRHDG
jgi:hypothetical protein